MTVTPLINAPLLIQIHASLALIAVILGPIAIHRKSRERIHKIIGYIWVSAMFLVATTALAIPAHGFAIVGPFGPIHLFVVLTYWSLWTGMRAIYQRNIIAHRAALRGLYWQGMAFAALFNFLPGRMINRSLFPENPQAGLYLIALGGVALIWVAIRQRRIGFQPGEIRA